MLTLSLLKTVLAESNLYYLTPILFDEYLAAFRRDFLGFKHYLDHSRTLPELDYYITLIRIYFLSAEPTNNYKFHHQGQRCAIVIQFLFGCQHSARLPRSCCKGTKHKITKISIKAACTAECLLTIRLRTNCSFCQYRAWEDNWKSKLERAAKFLAKSTERRMPGSNEIAALVKDLDEQYHQASWDARGHVLPRF
jgi:hypothetical protein